MTGEDASNTTSVDTHVSQSELAEMELQECHQHYRAAAEQAFKAVAFLATAIAVLLTVAIEQQSGLALVATAILPLAGYVIASYIGRQFGAATSHGAILEQTLHRAPAGFFWGHLRSANSEWTREYERTLESKRSRELPEHIAFKTWIPATRLLPLASLVLILLAPVLVLVFDWDWA